MLRSPIEFDIENVSGDFEWAPPLATELITTNYTASLFHFKTKLQTRCIRTVKEKKEMDDVSLSNQQTNRNGISQRDLPMGFFLLLLLFLFSFFQFFISIDDCNLLRLPFFSMQLCVSVIEFWRQKSSPHQGLNLNFISLSDWFSIQILFVCVYVCLRVI